MKTRIKNFISKTFAILVVLLFTVHSVAVADGGTTISRSNGDGYTTTLTSVTKVSGGYRIVVTVDYNGSNGAKGLNRFGISSDNAASSIRFDVIKGTNVSGSVDPGPIIDNFDYDKGFCIYNIKNFGRGEVGQFTITYTVPSLQFQWFDAEVWQDNGNTKTYFDYTYFWQSDFQYVYNSQIAVEAPTLTPASGTYSSAQIVTMSTATSGATIYYTTNNTTPTTGSSRYTSPITVSTNQTIKAIAVKSGLNNSSVTSETYTIAPVLPTPTFSPSAGTYTTSQSVSLSCATSGVTIRYTMDGSTPDLTSPIYSTAIPVSSPTTINAIAVKSGYSNSAIATGVYNVLLPVAAPDFSPVAGTFNTTQSVTITSSTSGASIYYTTDGTTPTITSAAYTGPVSIDINKTLKAIAVKSGMSNSGVTSGDYVIKCANPTFSPVSGTYNTFQTVALSSITPDVTIRYTTDGSDPSASTGTIYSTPIAVNATTIIKAIAYKTGANSSDVVSSNYNIQLLKVANPILSPNQGTYNSYQSVAITSATDGATIRYTTDGSDATATNGIVYTTPITVNSSTVIKAIAYKYGMSNSDLVTGSYVIQLLPASAPSFTPPAGVYTSDQNVTISTTTADGIIRYTTDGVTTPTETVGTVYTGPITINSTTTLKAIVYKAGMLNSPVTSGAYTFKCATPQFSPAAGNYNTFQSVTLTSATNGATIRYTTDGSQPTATSGTIYSAPIPVNTSTNIRAIAYKSGLTDSDVAVGIYQITLLKVATPTFSPSSGDYNTYQNITLSCATSGATIKYTTDGSSPSATNGTVYSTPVPITVSTNLKVYAFKYGMTDSDMATSTVTIHLLDVAAPSFSPVAGTYNTTQSVAITSTTSGASIYYTTNGDTPTASSTLYTGAISVAANTTLKAIAIKNEMNNSAVTSGNYTINCATPVLTPAGGAFGTPQSVTMTTVTPGASIYYTTDGSTPSVSSTLYNGTITVGVSSTIKAIAIKNNMGNSTVATESYTISPPIVAPIFTPSPGVYNSAQNVAMTTSVSGASIRFTTDGTTPSETAGTVYSSPVTISGNTTLKAIAYKSGMSTSSVTSGDYVINCATPILSVLSGSYNSAQSVTLSSGTPGASIYYTVDGNTPTASSTPYNGAISVGTNMTIKAIAIKAGMGNSGIASETYTILLPVSAPTFTPAAGSYTSVQSVVIGTNTPSAEIYYTLDGSDPTTASPKI